MIYPIYIPHGPRLYEIRMSGNRIHSIVVFDDGDHMPQEVTLEQLPQKVRERLDEQLEDGS